MISEIWIITRLILLLFILFVVPNILFTFLLFKKETILSKVLLSFSFGVLIYIGISFILFYFGIFSFMVSLFLYISISIVLALISFPLGNFQRSDIEELKESIKKIKIFELSNLILLFSLFFVIVTRFADPLSRFSLNASDPYAHIKMINELLIFDLGFKDVDSYHRGFHLLVIFINKASGIDLYSIMRFLGSIFSLISIYAIFTLVEKISEKRDVAALSAFAFAGFPVFGRWFGWQTLSIPEIISFPILLMGLFIVYSIFKNLLEDYKILIPYILAAILFLVILPIIHWLSTAALVYLIFIMICMIPFVYKKDILNKRISVPIGFVLALIILGSILSFLYLKFNTLNNVNTFSGLIIDVLKPKRFDLSISNVFGMIVISTTILIAFFKKKLYLFFFGISGLFFTLSHLMGIFYPSGSQYREGLIYAFIVAVNLGCLWFELLSKEGIYLFLKRSTTRFDRIDKKFVHHLHYCLLVSSMVSYLIFIFVENYYVFGICLASSMIITFLLRKKLFENRFLFGEKIELQTKKIEAEYITLKGSRKRSPERGYYKKAFIVLLLLLFLFPLPFTEKEYYHYGYDGVVESSMKIESDFEISNVTVYHSSELLGRHKIKCLYYPYELVYELPTLNKANSTSSDIGSIDRPDVFIFIEKEPYSYIEDYGGYELYDEFYANRVSVMENATIWMEEFKTTHNVSVYFEDDDVIVYHYVHGDFK